MSHLDEIQKLKTLLDSGAITEEEYEEQKRLILSNPDEFQGDNAGVSNSGKALSNHGARGKTVLLIGGIIALVGSAPGFIAGLVLTSSAGMDTLNLVLVGFAAAMMVIGILGIAFRAKRDKAQLFVVLGIVFVCIGIAALFDYFTTDGRNLPSAIFALAVGILYSIGAQLNAEKKVLARRQRVAMVVSVLLLCGLMSFIALGGISMPFGKPAIGDEITLGIYKGEPITWTVLDTDGDYVLLLSAQVLCKRPYNEEWQNKVTWENSDIRSYLNGDFLNSFSEEQQARIAVTKVINAMNPLHPGVTEDDTTDKVFLLSMQDANYYFKEDASRAAKYGEKAVEWWLRTRGRIFLDHDNSFTTYVDEYGRIADKGSFHSFFFGVRPALWVKLDS